MATLPSLGVLWAQPGTAWAGAHWRGATHSPTHVRTHARSLGHTHEPIRAVALPPITRLIFILESPFARSFPGALPWHALLTLVHTLAYTRVCIPPHTRSHSHTPSHTHESPFIQSHQLFGCTFQHSHTRVLTPTDTLHAHIGLACTYVLLHTCSPVRSPARRTQTPHIPGSRVLMYASV